MMQRIASGLLTVLVLAGAVLAGDPPKKARTPSLAEMAPAGALAHIELSGRPLKKACSGMALTKIWKEKEVQAFLAPALSFAEEQLAEPLGMLGAFGLEPKTLHALAGELRLSASVLGIDVADNGDGVIPRMLVSLDYGAEGERMNGLVDRLMGMAQEQGGGNWLKMQLAGRKVQSFTPEGAPISIYLARSAGGILLGTHKDSFVQALTTSPAASLAASKAFQQAAHHAGGPDSCAFVYADVKKIMGLAAQFADGKSREASMIFTMVESIGLTSIGVGVAPEGGGLRERIWMGSAKGSLIEALLPPDAAPARSHQLLPASTGYYASSLISLSGAWDAAMALFGKMAPEEAKGELEQGLDQARQFLGFDPRKDLLEKLDDEVVLYASWEGASLIPDAGLMLRLKDTRGFLALVDSTLARHGLDKALRHWNFQGHEFHSFDFAAWARAVKQEGGRLPRELRKGPRPRITWTVVDGFLVITPWPQAAKRLVAGIKADTPRLADKPELRKRLALMKQHGMNASHAVAYMDLKSLAAFGMDNLVPILQMLPTDELPFDLDVAALPLTETITQHLFGLVGSLSRVDGGYVAEYHSPMGYLGTSNLLSFAPMLLFAGRSYDAPAERARGR